MYKEVSPAVISEVEDVVVEVSLQEYAVENPSEFIEMNYEMQRNIGEIYSAIQFTHEPFTDDKIEWMVPNYYTIGTNYAWRFGGTNFHTGIDIVGDNINEKPVTAVADGTVVYVNTENTDRVVYGMYVIIDHGGKISTLYGQLSNITVEVGETVVKGQQIGNIGQTGFYTGAHLHFEIREHGMHVDPIKYYAN